MKLYLVSRYAACHFRHTHGCDILRCGRRYGAERVEQAFLKVQRMVINSLKCVAKAMINDKHCFELYGYDIMFDSKLKPWLIEVNASPSLSANTSSDYDLKFQMLYDAMDVLQLEKVVASASAMEACVPGLRAARAPGRPARADPGCCFAASPSQPARASAAAHGRL